MIKYNLWFSSLSKVQDQILNFESLPKKKQQEKIAMGYIPAKRLTFNVQNNPKDSFSLLEIDSLLARYKTREDFLKHLLAYNYEISSKKPLICTYKYQNQIKQLDLVFNSKLLYYYAILERNKTASDKKVKAPLTDSNEKVNAEFNKFALSLLKIAENPQTRKYITWPKEFLNDLYYYDKKSLQKNLPKGNTYRYKNEYRVVHTLHDALENYIRLYDITTKNKELGYYSSTISTELEEAQKDVYQTLRKDYQTLRSAIIFKQTVDKIENRQKFNNDSLDTQITYLADENNALYIEDPTSRQAYIDYLKCEKENEAELRKFAQERARAFQKKYYPEPGEDIDQLVDFGISPIEAELGEYDNEPKQKVKGTIYG